MAAELVFGNGNAFKVSTTNAEGLMQQINRAGHGERIQTATGPLPAGWAEVQTDIGVIYANPAQVAYVLNSP